MPDHLPPIVLCGSCQAEIRWAKTVNGKAQPLDAKPEKRTVVRLVVDGTSGERYFLAEVKDTFTPHHATCPQGAAWRRK